MQHSDAYQGLLMACKSAISVLKDSKRDIDIFVVGEIRKAVAIAEAKHGTE